METLWKRFELRKKNVSERNILYAKQGSISSGFKVRWMYGSGGVIWIIQAVKKCYCIVKETQIWHLYLHNKEGQRLLTEKNLNVSYV